MINSPKKRLLIIDDEEYIVNIVVESLNSEEYDIHKFSDPSAALDFLDKNQVDLVLTDLVMGEYSGIQILEKTLEHYEDSIVILMTAHPTIKTAISVLRKGAYDFMVKPFKLEVLKATVKRGLAHQQVVRENLQLKGQVEFLKVANAFGLGLDIDKYLKMVLRSCKTELNTTAAAIIEIDPDTGEIIRKVHETEDDSHLLRILDDSYLQKFAQSKSTKPILVTSKIELGEATHFETIISKPIYINRELSGLINLLVISRYMNINPGKMDVLTILTNSAATAIANNKLYLDLQSSYMQAIRTLANAIEARDKCTKGHTDRVTNLAVMVAQRLGWSQPKINNLIMGCTLHDIGKIGVPDSILNKPGQLSEDEREHMMNHPQTGLKIISGVNLFKPSIPYIISHHERFDGNGYPNGLKGEEIPIEGRLLSVVDTFDAILSDRPYRRGASLKKAVRELLENSGTQLDPDIVSVFIEIIREGLIDFQDMYGRDEDLAVLEELLTIQTEKESA